MKKVLKIKPTDKLELILLPPTIETKVTKEDVKNFYRNLIKILITEN